MGEGDIIYILLNIQSSTAAVLHERALSCYVLTGIAGHQEYTHIQQRCRAEPAKRNYINSSASFSLTSKSVSPSVCLSSAPVYQPAGTSLMMHS